ncbi:hypothetical protein GGQ88_002376 [Novosphingobium hassiacum]|uniref:HNH nuclease domain-containing protein n=1 Tax=Novosphingobium hassiacum TaxID=173676 RepID=A0A7W5ZYX9_9SPHN|nr:DUF262 domain-containing protein [Novosphingobium hassiacum]MBB3861104.1 hypothetical protein [Novosphingobium hassiacum]
MSDEETEIEAEELLTESDDEDDGSFDLPKATFTPVNFSHGTRRILDLYRSYAVDKELDPRPSFQRGYVWDRNRATKLIESILLHVPIPLIYTAEEDDGREVVIDGQQRLTSCFSFIEGFFPPTASDLERSKAGYEVKKRPFRLGKMKILKDLEGKGYSQLPDNLKKTMDRYGLQVIKISKESHPDVKFEIFERLNTGSVALADQEIRNCIYRGPYNDLINSLSNLDVFRKALGLSAEAKRMQDVELVLRFLAFNDKTHLNYNHKMKAFLNAHMRDNRFLSEERALSFKSNFTNASELAFTVFGENAFRRFSGGTVRNPNGGWERTVNKALYDCVMFWFARLEKRQVIESKDAIRDAMIKLCVEDPIFIDAITLGTGDIGRVRSRFEIWGNELNRIIDVPFSEKRLFSYAEKQELFDKSNTCAICSQRIESIDDAAVDHKHPYSKGGSTSNSNAQIAHRYCNRAKSDN